MSKLRIIIEIENDQPNGEVDLVRTVNEAGFEAIEELEQIDSCEQHLLGTGYEAMRAALGAQMSAVSKKKAPRP